MLYIDSSTFPTSAQHVLHSGNVTRVGVVTITPVLTRSLHSRPERHSIPGTISSTWCIPGSTGIYSSSLTLAQHFLHAPSSNIESSPAQLTRSRHVSYIQDNTNKQKHAAKAYYKGHLLQYKVPLREGPRGVAQERNVKHPTRSAIWIQRTVWYLHIM